MPWLRHKDKSWPCWDQRCHSTLCPISWVGPNKFRLPFLWRKMLFNKIIKYKEHQQDIVGQKSQHYHELVLGKSGPFSSFFLFCIGFPNFSRIFTTTLWKLPRDAEGAVWLSGPFLVSWLLLSPNSLRLTTMWLKAVLGFSILRHKRFPRLWLFKTYCSICNGELVDDGSFLDN